MALQFDTEPASHIKIDLFPAEVHPGGPETLQIGNELRVIVTDNHFYVMDNTDSGPAMTVKEPLVSFEGDTKSGYTVVTDKGTWYFKRAANCGCGARLRGYHPFSGVPHEARLGK